ncbi:MAG: Zn-dependent alcohol dehydrogenase [bacterium]|nr:Zn-dependent alcohol dehydrogenase [bacterium]
MRTRAAVLHEFNTPLVVEEVELQAPKANEVSVEMVSSGVCHSDLHIVQGHIPVNLPIICGHEGAGIVTAVGPGPSTVQVGDRVVLSWVSPCGNCNYCATGNPALCMTAIGPSYEGQLYDGTSRFTAPDGTTISHHLMLSTFSREVTVPASAAIRVPDDVPLEPLAVIGCAVSTGVGAVVNTGDVQLGDSVAVIGCGGVGLNAIQGARLRGAGKIIGVDISEEKLEAARRFGATHTVNASEVEASETLIAMTGGLGVDLAVEAIGHPETVATAVRSLRRGGTAVQVGIAPYGTEVSVDMTLLLDERKLLGCYYGSLRPTFDIPRYVELYQAGKLLVDELITAEIGQDGINDALNQFDRGEGIRSLVLY